MPIGVGALVFSYKYSGTIKQQLFNQNLASYLSETKMYLLSNDMLIFVFMIKEL
jgi:hypothetical protein